MRMLPVAAIPKGSVVRLSDEDADGESRLFTIDKISYSDPVPGTITWIDKEGMEEPLSAILRVEVVSLPDK